MSVETIITIVSIAILVLILILVPEVSYCKDRSERLKYIAIKRARLKWERALNNALDTCLKRFKGRDP